MRVYWKLIIFEVLLEILLSVAPGSLDTLATIAEYLVESSREASRVALVLLTQTVHVSQQANPYLHGASFIY
ncbi:hypothetical protein G7B40_005620 [Aetokthonos hydrillicola Thurmond2011]|jgi:uncharacterized membrane protein AbrB (regulator of aidB expression)|uniref:Uncharacterized protein n=1 Tax=Aetokthonos hydrillicola Thurmond2011 TaxID=2712845 RepID=A0AAP5M6F0_9CYAN|nr:hypothetical protein [Aetokthonos hydrillicola]MBO3457280.1 hypothetical protein [Aetokthonos hydrillicola CCALA 1050]MBW4586623.1 hypothetical protein [Aetokthonos hydrillicola CCALA 1050]MDR9894050.1 hypothetical protein [Aetokthonos hydrillicola Thurmond2011]